MRKIHRDIVGGFIFSRDSKLLLGKNRDGGVYEGSYVVPGGGVDDGETQIEALRREMLEETGIDIDETEVIKLNETSGQHEKTLRETGERVVVDMDFYNYKITIHNDSSDIKLIAEDDWTEPRWFDLTELSDLELSPPTRHTLIETGIIAD